MTVINRNIGKPLLRREDARLVSGRGRYVDDHVLPGMAWCVFARSPHAHAEIRAIDTETAEAMPGVLRVLTAADWDAAGFGKLTVVHPMPFDDGRPMNEAPRPAFARDKVCHVGDIVAAVIADDRNAALDAAEAVSVDYAILPAVAETARALLPDAPLIHPEFGTNLVFEIHRGDQTATADALTKAAKVVELELPSNRLAASPLEPRSYLCDYEPRTDRYTLWATAQMPHYLRR